MNNNMRRGHHGIEGWRHEHPRMYRQRNSGNPPFRYQRNINQQSRYAPLSLRPHRPYFNLHAVNNEHIIEDCVQNRYDYESEFSFSRTKDHTHYQKSHPKHINTRDHGSNYRGSAHNSQRYLMNNTDDMTQRQILQNKNNPISHWNNDINEQTYNNTYKENPHNYNKQHPAYFGHRPPASDHYVDNSIPKNAKSETFSRSVDDTVSIVRKKLLNREETPQALNEPQCNENILDCVNMFEDLKDTPSSSQVDQSFTKRKAPKARKVTCERIKNKIFNQLFKMDKEKIHKLLDNPKSSTKFEYALNSLLTESQNSFNQHMRSVAEKSLCSSSKEFMQNDNNTIYEDTFLKQMQCILDPQDTVLLEDIKPVVMEELSNLLQLDEIDNRYDNQHNVSHHNEKSIEEYPQDWHECSTSHNIYSNILETENYNENCSIINNNEVIKNTKSLFKIRKQRNSATFSPTTDVEHNSKVNDEVSVKANYICPNDKYNHNEPMFDANAELTEEEDQTFAELDRQYHVAVDHDFIENYELSNPIQNLQATQEESKDYTLSNSQKNDEEDNTLKPSIKNDEDVLSPIFAEISNNNTSYCQNMKQILMLSEEAEENQSNIMDINIINCVSEINTPKSNSRKTSNDQRPCHRKEKRKKSKDRNSKNKTQKKFCYKGTPLDDKSSNDSNKINSDDLNHCTEPKQKEKSNQFYNKKHSPSDKNKSEKYIKEIESIKIKPCEEKKGQNSTSSNHSNSQKNVSTQASGSNKSDLKCSLTSIDMFTETPKKITTHQAFRNTALSKTSKKIDEIKPNPVIVNQKSSKKLSKETQTVKHSVTSQLCQTNKKTCVTRAIQVNLLLNNEDKKNRPTDALERMKEIDLEIQDLLQEKFKLYNSLEKKEGTSYIPMQNLGMTVLNVNSFEDNENEDMLDTIANNFTNIPVEELEEIALETVEIDPTCEKQNKLSILQFENSQTNYKPNTLNFSLIEQFITEEDTLNDLVSTPKQNKKKRKRVNKRPKTTSKTKKKNYENLNNFPLKECYVLLLREDLNKYIIYGNKLIVKNEYCQNNVDVADISQPIEENETQYIAKLDLLDEASSLSQEVVLETALSSDIQIDMLDVSEDIVIGANEEKVSDEKLELVPINEEIILDNSQSSIEDVPKLVETPGGECRLYDYLADENLQHDSLVAIGNADAILAVECVGTNFLAAGLDGNVYYFNTDGQLINTLRGYNLPVTCLCIVKDKFGTTVYTGSLDSRIRNYDLETGLEKGPECNVLSPIQTMDLAWDTVFVGTKTGFVLQFKCKNNLLIPVSTVKFSDQAILALRAMKEGPRKVLLVAARSENVTIKDAETGLLLRTLNGPKMTVYTLLYEDGKVYCGTSSHQIQIFDYTSGSHVGAHEGGKGAICLRAAGGLLFAGCYDGCVYVYREGEPRPFAQLRGPNLMMLCLCIVGTKIIAGFKDRSLYIWKIPLNVLQEMIL